MSKHKPHKPHNYAGAPNPDLDGIKAHIRANNGWNPRAWVKPSAYVPPKPQPAMQVFAIWEGARRYLVRAKDQATAQAILDLQLA